MSSNNLIATADGQVVGNLSYENDQIEFCYDNKWRNSSQAYPLSLSMPLLQEKHRDEVVRPFIWGLLPDNTQVLERWGQRFQVSPRNPYRILYHVGEDCAGAIQFIEPNKLEKNDSHQVDQIQWLTKEELTSRITELLDDHSQSRRMGDAGHFSLAGAQPKTALLLDEKNQRWGLPTGSIPTTHILKPSTGDFTHYDQNEHFCLRLAEKIGLSTTQSRVEKFGDVSVIIVKRFDRIGTGSSIRRIHQEDMCQSLSCMPQLKYQNEGGPSAGDIFNLIQQRSSRPDQDRQRFLEALIFNWLIGGTDAHAKNYSFLIAGKGQVRLSPLYDISSCLPYPDKFPPRKIRLAMKIGSYYQFFKISLRVWEQAAEEWNIDSATIIQTIERMSQQVIDQLPATRDLVAQDIESSAFLDSMVESIRDHIASCV